MLACAVLAGAAGCSYPGADVPYVQTPTDVVAEMLRLAQVTANDVVYDLGSGDGRIVIAAARDFGARGVGIEIDPGLVAYSNELARKAGVSDRVTFRSEDLFDVNLSDATVVALYLSYDMNLRLRPKLLRELQPGSRIVSHDFDMGADWLPNQTIQVMWRDRKSNVFLWVVPPKS
ncbi:MAG TPA: methyltransferase domain-containing protein [Methylomirabilota bacterium]|nr:methyltransferase domain-containing protein [Methylomirabilota bacterium]